MQKKKKKNDKIELESRKFFSLERRNIMKRKSILVLAIVLMAVGFAAVSTTLFITGNTNVAINTNDFDVYFSEAYENGVEKNSLIQDKTHIAFTAELHEIDEVYELKYEVTNASKNYDVSVTLNVPAGNEYIRVTNDFDTNNLLARTSRKGTLTLKVIKGVTEEISFPIEVKMTVNGVERTELGGETIKHGTIYGVKREISTSSTKWERIEDSVGLEANATKDGSEVKNDFDSIYPWSDIITYNYDDVEKKETAKYGDENFKFDGSNGQVLTRIPEFYYKREQRDGVEYQYISKYPQEGFTKSDTFSIGRYTMSGSDEKVYSRSGVKPIVSTTITDFRNYARNLGDDFGQLDYRYFLIQMLYLVEYADYNSQDVLGRGNVNNITILLSGECDTLGMKSGTLDNNGRHSVIYRGIEDIFGNVWQFVDGINIKDNVTYINYNSKTYEVDAFDGDYQMLGYTNALDNGYISSLGYDTNHSLISFPTVIGGDANTYISDNYDQNIGNRIVLVGGTYSFSSPCGLWCWDLYEISSDSWNNGGARLLRYA